MINQIKKSSSFEDLPDEILLLICRYLSQINILDSLLNLNIRLNKTITSYRENIFLSHLSYNEFNYLINTHLSNLASNVSYLYINNCSMLNIGKLFEKKFNRIDKEFPLLRKLCFHQIDIETLENLSWRFNTMTYLNELNIDIIEDRLTSMPVQFDEFICGKLFSKSNSFQCLKLNLNRYRFNLHSLKQKCENLHYLTISVKHVNDLFILFDHLPNLEQLNITIGCSLSHDIINDTYSYEYLWWKVAYLTKFYLKIEQKDLTSHDNVLSNEIIIKIIENLYSLVDFKFDFDIKFSSTLQLITTKEVYINKYFPYVDGSLWERALERNDHRTIHFQLYFELDGLGNNYIKRMKDSEEFFLDRTDVIDFKPLLRTTFSSTYWLQKNTNIQCFTSGSKHVSIYILPIKKSSRTTIVDIIDEEISVTYSPLHVNIQDLTIISHSDSSLNISMTNLFTKYPRLIQLKIDSLLLLPPIPMICSNHLRSLSLNNYSILSCCQLLEYLPQVISLTITSSLCERLNIDSCSKISLSITRLKLIIESYHMSNFSTLKQYFPNMKEFYLIIKSVTYGSFDNFQQCEKFVQLSNGFNHLRYMELSLPIKQSFVITSNLESDQIYCAKTSNGHYMIFKKWL